MSDFLLAAGAILLAISAFWNPTRPRSINLFNLGWAAVVGAFVVPA